MIARKGRLVAVAALLIAGAAPLMARAGETPSASKLSPNFASVLSAGGRGDALVRFTRPPAQLRSLVEAAGLELGPSLTSFNVAQVSGPVAQIAALAAQPSVEYIEANERLQLADETGTVAIRVREAQEAVNGAEFKSGSNPLDGTGVGVAVVDSGADGTHPDLQDHIVHNYKMVGTARVDVGNLASTDSTSGHGTHVAGIVAGDGTASRGSTSGAKPKIDGTVTGVAPNAALTVYSAGEGINVLWATQALDHILTNYDNASVFPQKIRVINNSWGNSGGSAYNANSSISLIVKGLVAKGAVVVFAAGNDGGNGSSDATSGYCKDPTPGVICVANYNDFGVGTKDGAMDSSSSRGRIGSPANYPDVSAPGSSINSTCTPASGALCNAAGFITRSTTWSQWYGRASGTSMAAPMTTGVIALLVQAKPSLTPAQIEDVLQDTAHRFGSGYETDPQNPGGLTSFDRGAGLIDLIAALNAVGVTRPTGPKLTTLSDNDGGDAHTGAADLTTLTAVTSASGVSFGVTVVDATDLPAAGTLTFAVDFIMNGSEWTTVATLDQDGAHAVDISPWLPVSAPATSASLSGNTISLFVPKANLDSPASGATAFKVRVRSLLTDDFAPLDVMPSLGATTGYDSLARPLYARPFAF